MKAKTNLKAGQNNNAVIQVTAQAVLGGGGVIQQSIQVAVIQNQ